MPSIVLLALGWTDWWRGLIARMGRYKRYRIVRSMFLLIFAFLGEEWCWLDLRSAG